MYFYDRETEKRVQHTIHRETLQEEHYILFHDGPAVVIHTKVKIPEFMKNPSWNIVDNIVYPKSGKGQPLDWVPWLCKLIDWLRGQNISSTIYNIDFIMKDTVGRLVPYFIEENYIVLIERHVKNATLNEDPLEEGYIRTVIPTESSKIL